MMRNHPDGHLVVGIVDNEDGAISETLVSELLAGFDLKGDYAVSAVDEAGGPVAVHCIFEAQGDADQFSDAIGATPMERQPGWASQRSFMLDQPTRSAIADVLDMAPVGEPRRAFKDQAAAG